MSKKCVYCGCEITDDRALDVCDKCGVNVWGEKMFRTIVQNMGNAREQGDLCHQSQLNVVTNKSPEFHRFS